jgi:hypothetical protein
MAPADGGAPLDRGVRVAPKTPTRLTLHLGVLIQPYRARGTKASALTTGDVAQLLEARYGVMGAFYRVHQDIVAGALAKSIQGATESLLMGRRVDPWGPAMQLIQREFRQFISSREVERVGIAGVPTKAAMRGVNHRLKHPYARKNPRRSSFRDTGLYMASFRSWID